MRVAVLLFGLVLSVQPAVAEDDVAALRAELAAQQKQIKDLAKAFASCTMFSRSISITILKNTYENKDSLIALDKECESAADALANRLLGRTD